MSPWLHFYNVFFLFFSVFFVFFFLLLVSLGPFLDHLLYTFAFSPKNPLCTSTYFTWLVKCCLRSCFYSFSSLYHTLSFHTLHFLRVYSSSASSPYFIGLLFLQFTSGLVNYMFPVFFFFVSSFLLNSTSSNVHRLSHSGLAHALCVLFLSPFPLPSRISYRILRSSASLHLNKRPSTSLLHKTLPLSPLPPSPPRPFHASHHILAASGITSLWFWYRICCHVTHFVVSSRSLRLLYPFHLLHIPSFPQSSFPTLLYTSHVIASSFGFIFWTIRYVFTLFIHLLYKRPSTHIPSKPFLSFSFCISS